MQWLCVRGRLLWQGGPERERVSSVRWSSQGVGEGEPCEGQGARQAGLKAPGKLWWELAKRPVRGGSGWVAASLLVSPFHSSQKTGPEGGVRRGHHAVRDFVDRVCAGCRGGEPQRGTPASTSPVFVQVSLHVGVLGLRVTETQPKVTSAKRRRGGLRKPAVHWIRKTRL